MVDSEVGWFGNDEVGLLSVVGPVAVEIVDDGIRSIAEVEPGLERSSIERWKE